MAFRNERDTDRPGRQHEPDDEGVEDHCGKIPRPALQASDGLTPPRSEQFPQRRRQENAHEGASSRIAASCVNRKVPTTLVYPECVPDKTVTGLATRPFCPRWIPKSGH
jgi:hypothetical protein